VKSNYEDCLAITLKWEGGDVNHPDDPGGKTRWGITQKTYDAYRKSIHAVTKSVFTMTKLEMLAIYKTNYWDAVNGDRLAIGVDLATWDYGVNSGPARARKDLLSVVGGTDVNTIKKLCAKRMSFVKGLSTWKIFGKGWSNRIADIEAKGVAMALKAASSSEAAVKTVLLREGHEALTSSEKKVKAAGTSGATATATGASGTYLSPDTVDMTQWVSLGLIAAGVIAVGVMAYLVIKARHDKNRAQAYLDATKDLAE
jgi:lysozyme family protein